MQDELTLMLAKKGEVPRGLAFQAARRLGLSEFQWKDPKTGKVSRYHTRMAGESTGLPKGMKESDLYRNPEQERINKEYYDTTQQIERDYQRKLAGIQADSDLDRVAKQEAGEQKAEDEGLAEYLKESGESSDRAKIGQLLRQKADQDLDRISFQETRQDIHELAGTLPYLVQQYVDREKLQEAMPIHMASDRSKMGEIKRREDLAFRDWAAQKQQEQALEPVYPEALLGGLGFLRGLFGARRAAPAVRREPTMRDSDMMYYQGRPEPSFAGGGLASLSSQGRGGDSMLVHMSPDEVMNLQRMARMQGDTMTINPETGLPEAFNLRKLLRGLATIAPIAAAFFPPLAAALPALATPLGAGAAGAIAGGLSGEKGFDLKRGLTGGLLSYGLSSAMQGLKAAGGATPAEGGAVLGQMEPGIATLPEAGASPLATQAPKFSAQELAGLSPQARAAISTSGQYGVPMTTASEGIGNLLSSDAATRAAAQEAFTGQFGKGAMYATGIGALGTAALDEQEKFAKQALEQERISKEEYDKFMERVNQARRRAEFVVSKNPINLQRGGAIDTKNVPIRPYPVKFFEGGDGDAGGPGDAGSDGMGGDDSAAAADDAGLGASMSDVGGFGTDSSAVAADDAALGAAMSAAGGFAGPNEGIDASMGQAMTESIAAANANAAAMGTGGDGYYPPILISPSPFSTSDSSDGKPKKKWEEMTPQERELERAKYILQKYQMKFAAGGSVARRTPGIAALPPRYIDGKGDGMSDSVPAMISNKQPARLADGEFVIPADVVSHLGNGSSKAGAKQLYAMMDRVRRARTGNPRQGRPIKPAKQMPA
jgi:hypothetical protein